MPEPKKLSVVQPPPITLAEMLRQDLETPAREDAPVSGFPPSLDGMRRAERKVPVPDLGRFTKVWALIGPGGVGKSVLARWYASELAARGALESTFLAALDPGNRSLAHFMDGVQQPPSSDPGRTAAWLEQRLQFLASRRINGVLDFGGGDISLSRLLESSPRVADTLEEDGTALIAAYVLTPRVDDLAALVTFEDLGFRPRGTALILNLARAQSPDAFDAIRRQPAYRAAIDRGAVELLMPALEPQDLALRIERARLNFGAARDGAPGIGPLERSRVRHWLDRMAREFAAVETWLPWT